MIAHVGPVPVEEILAGVAGPGGGLMIAGLWLKLHLRRGR